MTTSTLSSRNILSKEIAQPYMPAGMYTPWERPSDWLTLPELTSTIKFVGLVAVFDDDNNYIALGSVSSTGSYTVDWGDGTSDTTSGAVTTKHKYNYSDLSSGTLTSRGYRQAVVTITVNTGTFDGIYLTYLYSATPTLPAYNANWLDIRLGSATLNSVQINSGNPVYLNMLENVDIQDCITSDPSLNFDALVALQQLTLPSTITQTSALQMFFGCSSLIAAPMFDASSCTTMNTMFSGCTNLQYVPPYNTSNVTNMGSMFSSCVSLKSIPQFDTSKVTNMVSMFSGCLSLTSIPYFNTSNVTNMTSAFDSCVNLIRMPMLDTPKVTNTTLMFNNCNSLGIVPLFNLSNCTTTTNMFANCSSLTSVPVFDTSKVTVSASMFIGCGSLTEFPDLNFSNVTNATSMFQNCSSLTNASNLSLPALTVAPGSLFNGCVNLITAPSSLNFSTIASGSAATVFSTNTRLKGNVSINVGNSTSISSMFAQCQDLTGANITGNSFTTASTTFNNCRNLRTVNFTNANSITTTTSMFATCTNLSTLRVPNLGVTFSIASTMLNKDALETVFTDLRGNTTAQTITISSAAGADVALARTGAWSVGSKTMTVSSATSIVPDMYVYGATVSGIATVSFNSSTNRVTMPVNFGLNNGTAVAFTTPSANGLTQFKLYYTINGSGDTFQLALTPDGSPVDITGTSSMSITWSNKILSVAGTTITFENPLSGAGTLGSTVCSFRYLNTYLASMKNWTVTG